MRDANVRGLVAKLSRRNERVTLRVEDIAGRYRWYLFGHDVLFGGVYGGERRARDISVRHVVRHARGRDHRREPDAPPEPQRDVGRCMMSRLSCALWRRGASMASGLDAIVAAALSTGTTPSMRSVT